MRRFYVDHNASTPACPAAVDALCAAVRAGGNPGSVHQTGQAARALVERARRSVQALLGVAGGRVIFTSGATEANNLALNVAAFQADLLAHSALEHPSVVRRVALSANLRIAHDGTGRVTADHVGDVLGGPARVAVSAMVVNNELGNVSDIEAIAERCAQHGVWLHVDAVQAFGRCHWRVPNGVSAVTVSAHKMGGAPGVGALWLREPGTATPTVFGGMQERGWRAGTENVPGIAAFGAACEAADPSQWTALAPVRDAFESVVVGAVGARRNGDVEARAANTSNLSFEGCAFEELLMALDLEGVECSAGSACAAGSMDPSPVVSALQDGPARARSALRFSFGPGHTVADAKEVARRVVATVRRVRG